MGSAPVSGAVRRVSRRTFIRRASEAGTVAQTSKSAVSRASKPASRRHLAGPPIWKSAIRQVWKPALQPHGAAPTKLKSLWPASATKMPPLRGCGTAGNLLSRRDNMEIARRFSAGNGLNSASSPEGTAGRTRLFQPSLRDSVPVASEPGVETPGYGRTSLRDKSGRWNGASIFLAPLQGAEIFGGSFRGYHPLARVQPPANFLQPFGLPQLALARTMDTRALLLNEFSHRQCGGI